MMPNDITEEERQKQVAEAVEALGQGWEVFNSKFPELSAMFVESLDKPMFSVKDIIKVLKEISPEALEKIRGPELRN